MTRTGRVRQTGFTLLEILVVIAIMSIVTSLGTATFISISSIWSERRAISDLDNQAQLALESIRADLASALSSNLTGSSLTGESREVKDDRTYPAATHADDSFSVAVETREGGVAARVGYRVERDGATGRLVRTTGPLSGGFPAGGRAEIAPVRVQGFSVEYLARGAGAVWTDTWTGPGLPHAVRVSLALESEVRPEFQTCRKAVIPIHVE